MFGHLGGHTIGLHLHPSYKADEYLHRMQEPHFQT